jgi:hypothetical protein
MKLLIDTCIVSELRKPHIDHHLKDALTPFQDSDLFLSVITIGEIAKGITLLNESQKKKDLTNWLNALEHQYSDRILPINREITFLWGEMTARAQRNGYTIPASDGLIAATALSNGLHLLTRNTKDFKETGVFLFELGKTVN